MAGSVEWLPLVGRDGFTTFVPLEMGLAAVHLPYRVGQTMHCEGCDMTVAWADLAPPPDFGKSGMAAWTDTDATG